ncbi:MAG: hypothetical protein CME59_16705 [Halioglobus sp.]|mgnify:FL=1|nr:hypothetical protein [Halioglobus sp.]|tara:strand:- start:329 stop:547 length:219 start_codon:yes stop_codon:yes gene_type:complete
MNARPHFTLLPACLLVLAGCTNQQLYSAIQDNRRQECAKLPQPQYEECLRDYDTSYEEYLRAGEDGAGAQGD